MIQTLLTKAKSLSDYKDTDVVVAQGIERSVAVRKVAGSIPADYTN